MMYQEFFVLNGYGYFVWPSFIFTLAYCFLYYVKTKKELKKQEKVFLNEFKYSSFAEYKTLKEEKIVKEFLPTSSF